MLFKINARDVKYGPWGPFGGPYSPTTQKITPLRAGEIRADKVYINVNERRNIWYKTDVMNDNMFLSLLIAVLVIVVLRIIWNAYYSARKLPPGPQGLPIIGEIFLFTYLFSSRRYKFSLNVLFGLTV